MGKKIYTAEQIEWLKNNSYGKFLEDIRTEFNTKFNKNLTANCLKSLLSRHHIQLGIKIGKCSPGNEKYKLLTDSELKIFKENNYGKTAIEMQDFCEKTFNKKFSVQQIKSLRNRNKLNSGLDGRFTKGHISFNKGKKGYYAKGSEKGWFKKGCLPACTLPVNTEIIDSEGYTKVKIEMPNKWIFKQRLIYEQNFGPIPEGYCIIFKDGNRQNFSIDNLMLVSNSENLFLTRAGYRLDSPELIEAALAMNRLEKKLNEKIH